MYLDISGNKSAFLASFIADNNFEGSLKRFSKAMLKMQNVKLSLSFDFLPIQTQVNSLIPCKWLFTAAK